MAKPHKIKTYEFNVSGFPTVTKTGRSRGKLLAGVFFDYKDGYDNSCTFKEFLQICRVVRVTSLWQKKVWINGEEAIQVGPEQGNCIPVMHDWNETPVWSHLLDVLNEPPEKITYDILMQKLDDNKFDTHAGTKWKCSQPTLMNIKQLAESKSYIVHHAIGCSILGFEYEINDSMKLGQIELVN